MKRKELTAMIQKAKIDFKCKVEDRLENQDARSAWQGLHKMMGHESRSVNDDIIDTDMFKWAHDLNLFYGRYDVSDNRNKVEEIGVPVGPSLLLTGEVRGCLILGPVKHWVQMALRLV